ncbi:MAG: PAS domain-containing methyl-accepting chemotaxis protein [Methylophaga sp.]|nr:PAS domain-containing methyl-accepting chemotaxis protein [Methylophaga sp.]
MKKNLPITDVEVPFPDGEEIISTTNLKGVITSFNETFQAISGFEYDELINKNHNVIRHPEIPPAAFDDLWKTVKTNQHWMGIIKNRVKNGNHYWVDAYVSPIVENGEVVGYESVRSKPSRERVNRADRIYKQINAGKSPKVEGWAANLSLGQRFLLSHLLALLIGAAIFLVTPEFFSALPLIGGLSGALVSYLLLQQWALKPLKVAAAKARKEIDNPLMALVYTGRNDEIGQIQLTADLLRGRLRTTLSRMKESAGDIAHESDDSARSVSSIHAAIGEQAAEMEQVATAMTEMTASIQEVARNASVAASKAHDADELSQKGVHSASEAVSALSELNHAIENIAGVVQQLDGDTRNIGQIIDVITNIADQTNLLALNAAIEAARAGEHGRGFAVVAEEVRSLASKTQASTQQIQTLIQNLNNAVAHAVKVMQQSQQTSETSEQHVSGAIKALQTIAEQVSAMNDLNTQIATAVEEQSAVSEDINRNIVRANDNANQAMSGVEVANKAAKDLQGQSHHLTNMISRFQQDS